MNILGIYGSPRKGGNTDILLAELLRGATDAGASVTEIFARKLTIAPCRGCASCDLTGKCVIRDDFDSIIEHLDAADAVVLATPIHFYTVSAHAMIVIDRAQSLWATRYVLKDERFIGKPIKPGALIAVGATNGKNLFAGLKLTTQYFFNAAGFSLDHELLVPGVDKKAEILEHPDIVRRAYEIGMKMAKGGS